MKLEGIHQVTAITADAQRNPREASSATSQ
jgi:hypothetical protein